MSNETQNPFEMLQHDRWEVRKDAVRLLRDLKTTDAFAALRNILEDDDMEIRAAATEALALYPQEESEPLLLAQLADPEWEVQWAAMRGLGSLWQEPVLRKMGDPSIEKRITSIETIGRRKEIRFIPLLIAALDDETDVQRVAIQALSPFYDPEIVEAMKRLADEVDDEILAMFHEYLEMRAETLPNHDEARLRCRESGLRLPYSRLVHVGTHKEGRFWIAKPHIEEFQQRIEPFEGKLKPCKQCKIQWPRYESIEGYCPSCREKRYLEFETPEEGFFRCSYTHKVRSIRDKSPIHEDDRMPLSHRGAYLLATQSPNTPFISHRALLFLRKAYQEGYLLCERLHQFLPRDRFPPDAYYLDPCVSIDSPKRST